MPLVGVNRNGEFCKSKILTNQNGITQGIVLEPILFVIFEQGQ